MNRGHRRNQADIVLNCFVRSGETQVNSGIIWSLNHTGGVWSSHSYSETNYADQFDIDVIDNAVRPSHYTHRWIGYPLRCLSTVLDMWSEITLKNFKVRLCRVSVADLTLEFLHDSYLGIVIPEYSAAPA